LAPLTTCARVNKSGFLETPFWRVINGKAKMATTLFNCGYRGLYKIAPAMTATIRELLYKKRKSAHKISSINTEI
jgi:hypothetical protein